MPRFKAISICIPQTVQRQPADGRGPVVRRRRGVGRAGAARARGGRTRRRGAARARRARAPPLPAAARAPRHHAAEADLTRRQTYVSSTYSYNM